MCPPAYRGDRKGVFRDGPGAGYRSNRSTRTSDFEQTVVGGACRNRTCDQLIKSQLTLKPSLTIVAFNHVNTINAW